MSTFHPQFIEHEIDGSQGLVYVTQDPSASVWRNYFQAVSNTFTAYDTEFCAAACTATEKTEIFQGLEGMGYSKRVSTALDNLIADKKLPPIVGVFLNSGGGDGKGSERGLEYDTVSDRYTQFIETEVLPRIAADYKVTFSKNPDERASMGGSSGAACAFTMAWFHPELYRRVLSYSGTFVDQQSPSNPESPHGAWEYHEHLIPQNPAKPIRIWMHVSEKDNGHDRDEASLHNWVLANQRMAAALKAKGYHYRYVFSKASGHVDGRVVGATLPDALLWLWRGDAAK